MIKNGRVVCLRLVSGLGTPRQVVGGGIEGRTSQTRHSWETYRQGEMYKPKVKDRMNQKKGLLKYRERKKKMREKRMSPTNTVISEVHKLYLKFRTLFLISHFTTVSLNSC